MARGWESKQIEAQIESQIESAGRPIRGGSESRTPEQIRLEHERTSLELTRTRVLHDVEAAQNPRYRAILQAALQHVEQQIAELAKGPEIK